MTAPGIDLVDGRIPLPLGGGAAQAVPASDVDVTIEGLPFWLGIDKQNPYQRQTAQYKKEQTDAQPEAGEQSLATWWLRSQMSFHYGSGQRYLDTALQSDPIARARFRDCRGVNVWSPGRVFRLNGTTLADPIASDTARVWAKTTLLAGVETLITAHGTTVRTYNGTAWSALTYGSTQPILGFAIDGINYYVLTSDGVYKQPIDGSAAAVKIYTVPAGVASGALGWVKARLMAAVNNVIYQLDCNAAASSALPTMVYTHPTTGWQFSCFVDTPAGIGAAGSAGYQSTVMQMKLDTSGQTPILDSAVLLLTMPDGEIITDALLHIGSMLILSTTRGVRVSTFQSYFGTITLGPNVVQAGDGVQVPCYSLGSYDRFVYAGTVLDSKPALMCVDLGSVEDQAGHYPWAPDLLPPSGTTPASTSKVTAIAFRQDGTKWFGCTGFGIVSESSSPDAAQPAWLQTSRIRLGTVEDKNWVHAAVRGVLSQAAPVTVSTMGPASTAWTQVFQAQVNGDPFDLQQAKSEWIQFRFDLAVGAELNSYQLQALPGGRRQRTIVLPLQVYDFDQTRSGIDVGYDGWALARLSALEQIEQAGAPVTLEAPALFAGAVRGVIEQITFTQDQDRGDRGTGTGGTAVIQFRTTT